MADITVSQPYPFVRGVFGKAKPNNELFNSITQTNNNGVTTFSVGFTDGDNLSQVWTLSGTDFTYNGNPGDADFALTGGTVTAASFSPDGSDTTTVDIDGEFTLDFADFSQAVEDNELDAFLDALLAGDDFIVGSAAREGLVGGAGDDTLDGGAGKDTYYGGEGDDVYVVDSRRDKIFEFSGEGTDTVVSDGSYKLRAHVEHLQIVGDTIAKGVGNGLDNEIIGNDAANKLTGRDGDDILDGQDGNDRLSGGHGDDILTGGDGTDRLQGGQGADIFVFQDQGASDVDTIRDFNLAEDRIDLSAVDGIDDLDDVIAAAEQVGKHIVLSTDNDSDLIIRKTQLDDLTADMFVFGA